MMTCRELVEALFDLAAGQLAPEHREHAERHLQRCPECVAYLESYRLTVRMARQLPRPPLPPRLARQLQSLLEGGGQARG